MYFFQALVLQQLCEEGRKVFGAVRPKGLGEYGLEGLGSSLNILDVFFKLYTRLVLGPQSLKALPSLQSQICSFFLQRVISMWEGFFGGGFVSIVQHVRCFGTSGRPQ